jgi:hypothetical protein
LTFPPRMAEISAMSWVGTTSWFLLPISTCMSAPFSYLSSCQTVCRFSTLRDIRAALCARNIPLRASTAT